MNKKKEETPDKEKADTVPSLKSPARAPNPLKHLTKEEAMEWLRDVVKLNEEELNLIGEAPIRGEHLDDIEEADLVDFGFTPEQAAATALRI
jgi:DNA-binding transcriptional ArsR family regulator